MTNYRFYRYLFIGWFVFFGLITLFGVPYAVKKQCTVVLQEVIGNGQIKAGQLAMMASAIYGDEQEKTAATEVVQTSIEQFADTEVELVLIDWSGKIIAHPEIVQVGSQFTSLEETNIESDYSAAELYRSLSDATEADTHKIIYLKDIPGTDLVIVAQADLEQARVKKSELASVWYSGLILVAILVLLMALWGFRSVHMYYDKKYQKQVERYEEGLLNIQQLNSSLESYKRKVEVDEPTSDKEEEAEKAAENGAKARILTYIRNELLPVSVNDIAYLYVENTITYVVAKNGKRSISNDSLDQIFKNLDPRLFFRANRQIIVSIGAIETILKYGNNQLKIQCEPTAEIDIIIGKNKAAQFKQWLNI